MNEQPSISNHQLSILIPTYNDDCRELVASLQQQADNISGLEYEILVADDGSTDLEVAKNKTMDVPTSAISSLKMRATTGSFSSMAT